MKNFLLILLVIFIDFSSYSQHKLFNSIDKYSLKNIFYTVPLIDDNYNTLLPIYIESDNVIADYPEYILFIGNVNMKQGNNILAADKVQLQQYQKNNITFFRTITATGNVKYFDDKIKIHGSKFWYNIKNKDINIYHGNYQMIEYQGIGVADIIKRRNLNRYTILENGTFTSCLSVNKGWSIMGSSIIIDRDKQIAKIWNARFKIGNIPIFYSPYLQIPIGSKRNSGFLFPNIKYISNNGFNFSIPYYLNLAHNYDITVTPNYISKLGIGVKTELRYLNSLGKGLLEFYWLPEHKICNDKCVIQNYNNRWILYWHHNGLINDLWRFNINYTKISDPNCLDYLSFGYSGFSNEHVLQKFYLGFSNENWYYNFIYNKSQAFNTHNRITYLSAPQIDLIYYQNNFVPFFIKIPGQVVRFINFNTKYPEAIRWHIEPTFNFIQTNSWGFLNIETKLIVTHFQQKNINFYNENNTFKLKSSINRILPELKIDGKIIFERNINFFNNNYIHTLEPRLQYLYIPYQNQDNIGMYDTTMLQLANYSSLFRDRNYSGLDRISSANQLASGLITRIYNNQQIELFNIFFGRIYYFSEPQISDMISTLNKYFMNNFIWIGDSYWHINDNLNMRGNLQYNFYLNKVFMGNTVLEYWHSKNNILQIVYRYTNSKYITKIYPDINYLNYQQNISQIGIIGKWLLNSCYSLFGSYYYDTKVNQKVNQLVGLQYKTCCWGFDLSYERKITNYDKSISSIKYDNKVSFNIEIRGFNNNSSLSIDKILSSGILPYQHAF